MLFSQQVIVQNTSEIVRLKGNYLQFSFLQVTNTYEHFTSIYEHLQELLVYDFSTIARMMTQARGCSRSAHKCS